MSDIFVPGISSRFNTPQMVEDLMRLERIPRDRAASNIERIQAERGYWQDLTRRAVALQESARHLFSFQNPFNNRIVSSSDEFAITATAGRDAMEQERSFTVRQLAQADRFLSAPQEQNYRVESGTYTFTVGDEEISFDFRGGSLREFADALNRRGRDVLQASLIAVRPGTTSLIIESRITGEENRLTFSGAAITLGEDIGMLGRADASDPENPGGLIPLNAVTRAQDSIIFMEGIEIRRSGNEIDDLIPSVTLTLRETSERPVRLQITTDQESVKDSIIAFVGNYNRLLAEINILTRNDPRIIDELTYFTRDEREAAMERLGAFAGDSSLNQLRNSLMRIVSSPFPTSDEQDLALLAQIGISTDVRRAGSGGADISRLRGYLDIDERALDNAIATRLPAVRQLFGSDTTGDLLVDTGIAFSVDTLTRSYSDRTGIFAQRASGIDSRIAQETQRIATLDRQLANREVELRRQFSQMEGAFNRMEQMSSSLDRFQMQNNNNR